jgi:putative ABC transport system permease protein
VSAAAAPRAPVGPAGVEPVPRSRLLLADVLRVASVGLQTRRLRAALSALGVAIGIAAMVAVLGISDSSKAGLEAELNQLGTNLLTVSPGQTLLGADAELPEAAGGAVRGLSSVLSAAAITTVSNVSARRSPYIEAAETSGIGVDAADPQLLATLGGEIVPGASWAPATNACRWSCSEPWQRSAWASAACSWTGVRCRCTSAVTGSPSPASSARSRSPRKSNARR